MKLSYVISSAVAVALLALSSPVSAQNAAVQERSAIMKTVSGTLKALDSAAKAGKTGDAGQAAKALAGVKKFTTLFPAGTGSDKIATRAKPEIWAQWAKFETEAGKLVSALTAVEAAAKGGDAKALAAAVKTAQGVCGGCHKPFRGPAPKKK